MGAPPCPDFWLSPFSTKAVITDVSARDGLQAEPKSLPAKARAAWVRTVLSAGVDEVEAASFVNPALLPQMAGAAEVFGELSPEERKRAWALVPNIRGLNQALAAGVENVLCVASATEAHSRKNLGRNIADVLADLSQMARLLDEAGARGRIALSVAWGDPDQRDVEVAVSSELAARFKEMGFGELTLCDTYGAASPLKVSALIKAIAPVYPAQTVGLHLHDTFGFAAANVLAGLHSGVSRFDGSVLGLGGCPFLKGARGNIDTANLVRFLNGMGVATSPTLEAIENAAALCGLMLSQGE